MFKDLNKPDPDNYLFIPVKRRGNERYHKYTWSRIQNNINQMLSYPWIFKETNNRGKTNHLGKGKIMSRQITEANCIFMTTTIDPEVAETPLESLFNEHTPIPIHKAWNNTTEYLNNFMTKIRQWSKRNNNKLLFYIRAIESHESGYPHMHFIMIFEKPFKFYAKYDL